MKLKKRSDFKTDEEFSAHLKAYQIYLESLSDDGGSLKKANADLLDELKKTKKRLKASEKEKQDKLDELEQQKLKDEGKLEELIDKLKENHDKELKQLKDELKEKEEVISKSKADLKDLLITKGLNDKLIEIGVTDPTYLEACIMMISKDAEIDKDADGKPIVVIGDKPVDDFISEFKEGKGKSFITHKNSGGGSGGGDNSGGSDDWEKYFDPSKDTFNQTKQLELKGEDEEQYNKLRKKFDNSKQLPFSNVQPY